MRIGIMTRGLSHRDAIGNDAAGMWKALRGAGHDAMLFTATGESELPGETFHYADLSWKLPDPDDLLIYHYSANDPGALAALRQLGCRTALRYHNITPSKYAAPYSSSLARSLRGGTRELARLLELPFDWILGASAFNIDRIEAVSGGAIPTEIVAPFNDAEALLQSDDEPATLGYLDRFSTNIVTVGRIEPNKGHELMLSALSRYLKQNRDRPHLHIIGKEDIQAGRYRQHLDQMVRDLEMSDCVTFHPNVGTSALATYYRHSDIYWTTGQYEGFCVPVVEAMAFSLPVISTTAGALPQTGGDAVLYADTTAEIVQRLAALLGDDAFLLTQGLAGNARFRRHFTRKKIEADFLAFIDRWSNQAPAEEISADLLTPDRYDWFGLPSAEAVVRDGLAHYGPASARVFATRDARIDFLAWLLTEGRARSAFLDDYFQSAAFARFVLEIPMPNAAAHLSGAVRLSWLASRAIQAIYPLDRPGAVEGLQRWFWREGLDQFGLHHLLGESEQRLRRAIGASKAGDA